jgi:hypothetical protein
MTVTMPGRAWACSSARSILWLRERLGIALAQPREKPCDVHATA